jgi:hypothetical protein
MAEYLHMPDGVIRARIANAMEELLRAQELQIEVFGAHYNALYTGEIARFTRAYERSYPITVSDDEVRRSFARAFDSLRDTVEENSQDYRAWEAQAAADMRAEHAALEGLLQTPGVSHEEQKATLKTQIADLQERLDDLGPWEDWSQPGRYGGHNDDELEAQLSGQLQRLQVRLDALTQLEASRAGQHHEEGMGY